LPPYPEPTDQMSFSSGKWRMKRRSGLRSPRECRPFTKSSRAPSCFMAAAPMRVMMRMLATTYGLSVSSTPTLLKGEPIGPIR